MHNEGKLDVNTEQSHNKKSNTHTYKRNILRITRVFQVIHNIPQAVYIHEFLKKLDPSPATVIQVSLIQ